MAPGGGLPVYAGGTILGAFADGSAVHLATAIAGRPSKCWRSAICGIGGDVVFDPEQLSFRGCSEFARAGTTRRRALATQISPDVRVDRRLLPRTHCRTLRQPRRRFVTPGTFMDRRLTTILVADVVGFSRQMAADEEGVVTRLRALRAEVIDPRIAAAGGRLIKTMGDGFLIEFPSAVAAVRAALAIQTDMRERGAGDPEDRRLRLRMGINVGDIVIDGDDILGDGVNIAARLEPLAPAGGVCISRAVYEQVRGKVDVELTAMGAQRLKNIPEPVDTWHIRVDDAASATRASGGRYRRKPSSDGRKALGCRPAVRQYERRPRAGLLRRRHHRRHHHRAVAIAGASRHRPQLDLHLQGQGDEGAGRLPRPAGALRSGRQRPQGRTTGSGDRPAHRRRFGRACLGGTIRSRPCRHIRRAGRRDGTDRARPRGATDRWRTRSVIARQAGRPRSL